jgi:hypothetical protein
MLTRAQVEAVLVGRCGPLMEKAGLAVTVAGSNASLTDPLRTALSLCGAPPASPDVVTSTDLAALPAARLEELLDRAELRTLQTIHRRLKNPAITVQGISIGTLANQVRDAIDDLRGQIADTWGVGAVSSVGVAELDLGFQEDWPS